MEQPGRHESRMSEVRDLAVAEYRPVCGLAIVALVLGVLSFLSMVTPVGWVAALLGAVLGVVSLRRIAASEPLMIGRSLAVAGVLLSVFFGCVGLAQWVTMDRLLTRQAVAFGLDWFEALRHDQPLIAHQLSVAPRMRPAPGSDLLPLYKNGVHFQEQIKEFVRNPVVRAVLALGEKAEVRPSGVRAYGARQETMEIQPVYAVTYSVDGRKKTFFAALTIRRDQVADTGTFTWQVSDFSLLKQKDFDKPPK